MPKFKRIYLDIRQQTLEKLIFSYLSEYAPTRASVSEKCNVSKMTSGKAANALIESGFMRERQFSINRERPCFHLLCNDGVRVLVIDLSSSEFKMSIVNSLGETKYNYIYNYDTSITPDENFRIFFSRGSAKSNQSGYSFCSISVIYADISSQELYHANIPLGIKYKDYITELIRFNFKKDPASHLTLSESIAEAFKFNVHNNSVEMKNLSYVFVGRHLSAFHIHQNQSITVCLPSGLLPDHGKILTKNNGIITKKDSDEMFIRLAHFMGCAFSPSFILLESDILKPDKKTAELLIKRFALSGQNPPIVYFKNHLHSLCHAGAVKHTLFKIIKRYVLAQKT